MSALPLLALVVALAAFCGLLLHLRWDPIGAGRMGALPLEDPPHSFSPEDTRER